MSDTTGGPGNGPGSTGERTLEDLLAELADLGRGPAPEPSAGLAALLGGEAAPAADDELRRRRRHRRLGGTATAVALIAAASTGWSAAAAHDLPGAVHHAVSGLTRVFDSSETSPDQESWGSTISARKSPGRVEMSPTTPPYGTILRPRSRTVPVTPAPVPGAAAPGTGGQHFSATSPPVSPAASPSAPAPGHDGGPGTATAPGQAGPPAPPTPPAPPAKKHGPGENGPKKSDPVPAVPVGEPPATDSTDSPDAPVSSLVGPSPGSSLAGNGKAEGLVNGNPAAPGLDKGDGTSSGAPTGKGPGVVADPGGGKPGKSASGPGPGAPVKVPVEVLDVAPSPDLPSADELTGDRPAS